MKTLFSTLFILSISLIANAQITITNSTFPNAGDTLKTILEISPSSIDINPTTGSTSAFWDFSNLGGVVTELTYDSALNGTNFSFFPTANIMTNSLIGETYYTKTNNKIEYIGYMGPDPLSLGMSFPIQISPTLTERKAPLDFTDSYSDNGSALIPISIDMIPSALLDSLPLTPDTMRILIDMERTNFVDGWGTIKIPNGTYYTLREKRVETKETRLEIGVYFFGNLIWQDVTSLIPLADLGKDTTTNYIFYGENSKEILANVSVNNDNNDIVKTIEYKQAFGDTIPDTTTIITPAPTPNGIRYLVYNNKFQVFPNPAHNNVQFLFKNLKKANYSLKIYSTIGRVVWEKEYFIDSDRIISEDISSISKGVYSYSLLHENKTIIKSDKLIVN